MRKFLSFITNLIFISPRSIELIRTSNLFDADWYITQYTDVAKTQVDPAIHYLKYGGFEGRDPGPNFSSACYLETYQDVKRARLNPLVHFLEFGRQEGREPQPAVLHLICPVCKGRVDKFLPISSYYEENKQRYGNPFTFDDVETINPDAFQCPLCNAIDRDRLYALYLRPMLEQPLSEKKFVMLDIAPSQPLKRFLLQFQKIIYKSADKYMQGVDLALDIADMESVRDNAYDFFICSHVLEHVPNDRKALAELFRILKPGGFGILMVPINLKIKQIDEDPHVVDVGERWRRFGQDDHIRLYSKAGFMERVEAAGFEIQQYDITYWNEEIFSRHGISPKSVLYIGKKIIQSLN